MSKKMTPAMRLWRDENMEAIREGVKAFKEGRTLPADTFFEWMQAKYVRDIWEARIARLQERVDGMREEGCAALGLVENILNGLTTRGRPTDPVLAQMAEAAATLLHEATPCGHKALAERRRKSNEQAV